MAACVWARPRHRAQRRPLAEQAAVVLEVGVNPVTRSSFKLQRVDNFDCVALFRERTLNLKLPGRWRAGALCIREACKRVFLKLDTI